MESKIILDGRFRVTRAGEVFRIKNGCENPARINTVGRNKNYQVVTYAENGKQQRAYVHRLVAGAFLPNPNHYPQVSHLDGNPLNNMVDNLQWCTAAQTTLHAYAEGLIDPLKRSSPCAACGEVTLSKTGMCMACRRKVFGEQKRAEREYALAAGFVGKNLSLLSSAERKYAQSVIDGLTPAEIAHSYGVTRQCVCSTLDKGRLKLLSATDEPVNLPPKEEARIRARIIRGLDKERRLSADIEKIRDQLQRDREILEKHVRPHDTADASEAREESDDKKPV